MTSEEVKALFPENWPRVWNSYTFYVANKYPCQQHVYLLPRKCYCWVRLLLHFCAHDNVLPEVAEMLSEYINPA
jgi:hypothetical protein